MEYDTKKGIDILDLIIHYNYKFVHYNSKILFSNYCTRFIYKFI